LQTQKDATRCREPYECRRWRKECATRCTPAPPPADPALPCPRDPPPRRVEYRKDTKVKDAATFVIQREDHTLGDVLRHKLLQDRAVVFAAYRIPHPMEHVMHLRVQTNGEKTPAQALVDAIDGVTGEFDKIQDGFDREFSEQTAYEGVVGRLG